MRRSAMAVLFSASCVALFLGLTVSAQEALKTEDLQVLEDDWKSYTVLTARVEKMKQALKDVQDCKKVIVLKEGAVETRAALAPISYLETLDDRQRTEVLAKQVAYIPVLKGQIRKAEKALKESADKVTSKGHNAALDFVNGVPGDAAPSAKAPSADSVEVPDVCGKPEDAAKAMLAAAGLGPVTSSLSGAVPPSKDDYGKVHHQIPAGGARVKKGAPVTVSVFSTRDTFLIRSVKGLGATEAMMILKGDQLKVRLLAAADGPKSKEEEYTVQSQTPAAGTEVSKLETVYLYVYGPCGGKKVMPSIVGMTPAQARSILAQYKLTLYEPPFATDSTPDRQKDGCISSQSPDAGAEYKPGSAVGYRLWKYTAPAGGGTASSGGWNGLWKGKGTVNQVFDGGPPTVNHVPVELRLVQQGNAVLLGDPPDQLRFEITREDPTTAVFLEDKRHTDKDAGSDSRITGKSTLRLQGERLIWEGHSEDNCSENDGMTKHRKLTDTSFTLDRVP